MSVAACVLAAAVCAAPLPPPHVDVHAGPNDYILELCGGWWCHTWDSATNGTLVCTIRIAVGLEPFSRAEKEEEERAACLAREGHP